MQYPFYAYLKCPHCGENMVGTALKTRGLERAWTCGGTGGNGTTKAKRSACPPVCVKEKYITNAIATAFQEKKINLISVEYCWLKEHIKSITFAENDWRKLVVNWLDGTQTVIPIAYEKTSDIPVEKVIIDGDTVYFDDKKIGKSYADKIAAQSILGIQNYLQELTIIDDEICPIVLRPNTKKGNQK
jgi:hypothetical protein